MPFPFLPLLALAGSALAAGGQAKTGKSGKFKKLDTMTPEQMQQAAWARQQGQNQISNPTAGFEPIAQNVRNMYQNQVVPTLAERFTSMGSGAALSSPAFASQLDTAGKDLQSSLAALQSEYGLRQQGLGQQLLGMGMKPQFENVYQEGSPTFLSGAFGGLSRSLGAIGGAGMGQYFDQQALNNGQRTPRQTSFNAMDQDYIDNYDNAPAQDPWQDPEFGLGRRRNAATNSNFAQDRRVFGGITPYLQNTPLGRNTQGLLGKFQGRGDDSSFRQEMKNLMAKYQG